MITGEDLSASRNLWLSTS